MDSGVAERPPMTIGIAKRDCMCAQFIVREYGKCIVSTVKVRAKCETLCKT